MPAVLNITTQSELTNLIYTDYRTPLKATKEETLVKWRWPVKGSHVCDIYYCRTMTTPKTDIWTLNVNAT